MNRCFNYAALMAAAAPGNPIERFAVQHTSYAGNRCFVAFEESAAIRAVSNIIMRTDYLIADTIATDDRIQLIIIQFRNAFSILSIFSFMSDTSCLMLIYTNKITEYCLH